jgi:hypothetical protein
MLYASSNGDDVFTTCFPAPGSLARHASLWRPTKTTPYLLPYPPAPELLRRSHSLARAADSTQLSWPLPLLHATRWLRRAVFYPAQAPPCSSPTGASRSAMASSDGDGVPLPTPWLPALFPMARWPLSPRAAAIAMCRLVQSLVQTELGGAAPAQPCRRWRPWQGVVGAGRLGVEVAGARPCWELAGPWSGGIPRCSRS